MGKTLLTLFYHTDESHAMNVCSRLMELAGHVIPYKYSSPNGYPPDAHLRKVAIESGCNHILTIHSDLLDLLPFGVYIFSDRRGLYAPLFQQLQNRFGGEYGFDEPPTYPVQMDLELNEQNRGKHKYSKRVTRPFIRFINPKSR